MPWKGQMKRRFGRRLDLLMHWNPKLPNGFETKLGERGVRLSEASQRIAIIVPYCNPDILILDEATFGLCVWRLIQESLEKLCRSNGDCDRLSTVSEQIRWWCWSRGVLEQGGYQELLETRQALKYHHAASSRSKARPIPHCAPSKFEPSNHWID